MNRFSVCIILAAFLFCNCATSTQSRLPRFEQSIIPVAQWGGTAPRDSLPTHQIRFITLHHGGEEFGKDKDPHQYLVNLQNWSRSEKKWMDVPYHFLIDLQGRIYEGRSLRFPGDTNTAYDPTDHALVCVLGNYEVQKINRRQLRSVVDLFAWLCWKYGLSPEVIRSHKDVAEGTVCPGKDLYAYLANGYLIGEVKERLEEMKER